MDQFAISWKSHDFKTVQSFELKYHKFNWAKTIRHQQIIFQWDILKCIADNFPLHFD